VKGDRCFPYHLFSYVSFPGTKFLFRLRRQFQTNSIFQFFFSLFDHFFIRFLRMSFFRRCGIPLIATNPTPATLSCSFLGFTFLRVRLCLCVLRCRLRAQKLCSPLRNSDMRRRRQTKLFIDTFGLIDDCKQEKDVAQDDLADSMECGHDHLRDDLSLLEEKSLFVG
jgi:hypothetical protein